ncbi:hypothetical protein BATDEDRAFT_36866 [Batrachochytrium dendrobatidis JAM81]|uniref:GH26 domain-containing protein n=2 Tax=Batrachochytrium dendrobatidis TaxID=109871 RepID=F4P0Q3_BATDJ|nr:uncharacterized protein BATDEDRAFT_36866 [Batrachochytrium dendrobatidis JAM81]EGF81320.1 hypothetical protein BATDEDRAFT_36866 [Batrachochytrium dendrobatidis JAM81]KAJ8329626.1 hypothetical protein O5D80_002195 [Batrachochytrium dendrobatidis]KAJ8329627.1 hypothetical protein O5D80_002195 [Batrachochytrium dendrobatidis]KAK5669523.1 hypothetical protein QVD99_003917 [Batrachochytrium dendrobatidis]|eukprot:XP_006678077.1 hypothetical protein BATDEDRAFT_36866 [Batrachochytrium dendrobatidis JAM81]
MVSSRQCCGLLFALKATFAGLAAIAGLSYQAYLVYTLYGPDLRLAPVIIPPPGTADASLCFHDVASGKARLEPPPGTFWFGFSLDWSVDVPDQLNKRIGKAPVIFNSFVNINATGFQSDIIIWNAQQAGQVGAMLELTLMPTAPIDTIPTTILWSYATLMRQINSQYGVPVLLRFGHEMNGPWMTNHGMRPRAYVQAFATLSSYVRANTNMTAMLWSPNIGNSYPFGAVPGQDPTPAVGTAEFAALDTNKDGQLTILDDPYGPYYPGDEWVDWVGVSVYNYLYDNNHQIAPIAVDVLTTPGEVSLTGADAMHNFYQRFPGTSHKPFILSETGSAYQTGGGQVVPAGDQTQFEMVSKRSWWNAILHTAVGAGAAMPKLFAAVWFEEQKREPDSNLANVDTWRDFRITFNTTVRNQFVTDVNALGTQLDWAGSLSVKCNGEISIKT